MKDIGRLSGVIISSMKETRSPSALTHGPHPSSAPRRDSAEPRPRGCSGLGANQSIIKEIIPEYSQEGLMLKLKLQYFGHLM